jgi:hypothetical protein
MDDPALTAVVPDPLPRLPADEARVARAAYLAALERFPPTLKEAGRDLIDCLDTPNWALEWSLPYWLGNAFGLQRQVIRSLTLANLFGLAYVRLQDDMIDGELAPDAGALAPLLATALYHLWLEPYRTLFDAASAHASTFWRFFDGCLAAWLDATLSTGIAPAAEGTVDEAHALWLARRGAPLKVGAVAACLLAGRVEDVAAVSAAVDHVLGAAVLIDHVEDWRADVGAGRYNAFVAYAALQPGDAGAGDARGAVLEEVYLGDAGGPYFDLVGRLIDGARAAAQPLACAGLERFLDRLEENVAGYRRRLSVHAGERLRAAVSAFFEGEVPLGP